MVVKQDLLDQVLDDQPLDPVALVREPLMVHEATPIFKVLEQFKRTPVRLAIVLDEYGSLEGIVTKTDLLEAIAGDLAEMEGEEPDIVERADGSLLIDRLRVKPPPVRDFSTIAGFALMRLEHVPEVGETFHYQGWCFEIIDMDGRRIDKLLARRDAVSG